MPQVDSYVTSNYRRTYESSNFGTRKLAFYMVNVPHFLGLADNWQEPNSLYYQIVQQLQENGAELYWLGTPNYFDNIGYDDCFTFAMADDAESPVQRPFGTNTLTATATDSATNQITVDSTNNIYSYNTYVTFSAPTIGGIIAGKKYYIESVDTGSNLITLSNEPNGSIVTLTDDTGSMPGTYSVFDTFWTGTAGDTQFGCCNGPDGAFQCISAMNFIFGPQGGAGLWSLTNGAGWIERLVPTSVIAPRWVAIFNN